MIHGLVDTEGLTFDPVFDDIDALNGAAVRRPEDEEVVKISYAALPQALSACWTAGALWATATAPCWSVNIKFIPTNCPTR